MTTSDHMTLFRYKPVRETLVEQKPTWLFSPISQARKGHWYKPDFAVLPTRI